MNRNEKLIEATMLALRGKLREGKKLKMLEGIRATEEHEYEFDDLYDIVGENGKSVLDDIRSANKEDEFMDYLTSIMSEDAEKLPTVEELSDFIDYDYATIFRDLEMKTENRNKSLREGKRGNQVGVCPACGAMITQYGEIYWDDEGIGQDFTCSNCKAKGTEYYNTTFDFIELQDENLDEAKNPENDEINTKIRKTLNGSTKYIKDLSDAGLEVVTDDNGKATMVRNPNKVDAGYKGMNKTDLKNSNPDTDYYNYMTKQKEVPTVTDTGAITSTNVFRNSDNFDKTYGGNDTTYNQEDRNGVSKAIPKKYKTGNKNYDIDMNKFPRKSYNGVASYEPLYDKELNDFKNNKSQVSDNGYLKRKLDIAQAEYDTAKQDYDKVNNQVNDVRARIAKSKAKSDKN